jgi:hypothetical protein
MFTAEPGSLRAEQQAPEVALGVGKREALGPSPFIALALAVLVGALVFAVIWKVRKTFGMRE